MEASLRHTAARRARTLRAAVLGLALVGLRFASTAHAQAGPPYLTNDPGTPGNGNWEINVAVMPTINKGDSSYQVPQFDINLGLGERIQLSYEVPYIFHTDDSATSGWGNGFTGIK